MSSAEAKVVILGDVSSAESALRKAGGLFAGFAKTSVNAVQGLAGSIFSLKGALTGLVTSGVAGMGVKFNAEMEQARIAFTTMLGSAEQARFFLGEMQQFAAETPFEFPDVQDAARRFLALGFSARDVIPTLRTVGDAVAALGGGKEMINGVVMALGQMKTKGTVQAEELLQLAERGIPAYEILQKKLKLTGDEVQNIGKAGISADVAIQALLQGMNERFAGAMQAQSRTLAGLWSTLKDNMMMLLGDLTAPLADKLRSIMPAIINLINNLRAGFEESGIRGMLAEILPPAAVEIIVMGATRIQQIVGQVINWLKEGWQKAGPEIGNYLYALRNLFDVVWSAIVGVVRWALDNVWPVVVDVLGRLYSFIGDTLPLIKRFFEIYISPIVDIVTDVFNWLAPVVRSALGVVFNIVRGILAVLTGDWSQAWDALKRIAYDALAGLISFIRPILNILPQTWEDAIDRLTVNLRMKATELRDSNRIIGAAFVEGSEDALNQERKYHLLEKRQIRLGEQAKITAGGIGALSLAHNKAAESAEKQTEKLKRLEEQMAKTAKQAAALYGSALGGARQAVSQGLLSYGEARAYAGSVVKQELGEEGLRAAWQAMKKEYYEATPEALANMFKWQYGVEPPKLALGGIVTGPTLAMIGERGPEAVVPLNRMPPAVNVNLTVNVNGSADRADAYGLARQIKDILQQELRQQRLAWR